MVPQELVLYPHAAQNRVVTHRQSRIRANLLSTGRTTFVNTLCSKGVLQHKESDDAGDAHVEDGVKIKPITVGA